ncbi:hypothetical protein [Streptomyces sp. NPDC020917]|uniref:hypothetical protein n=1 Tax=Streptomyces sp. NPDC020917 TaxID=3365102 RepID=UPI00379B17EF
MEQPIGQNVKPTTPAAGTDPAFFPGLVPPQSAALGETGSGPEADGDAIPAALRGSAGQKPAPAKPEEPEAAQPDEAADADDATDTEETTDTEEAADAESAEDDEDDEDADVDDGKPVFEVSDRRAAIIADRRGVTFTLDGETAEFGWDEIGAVEIDTPRFGKRFGVTVYTSTRRWFQCDVEAPSRSALKEWAAELDAVLDARFDDEKPETADEPDEVDGAEAEAAETPEVEKPAKADEDEPAAKDAEAKDAEAKDSASADA